MGDNSDVGKLDTTTDNVNTKQELGKSTVDVSLDNGPETTENLDIDIDREDIDIGEVDVAKNIQQAQPQELEEHGESKDLKTNELGVDLVGNNKTSEDDAESKHVSVTSPTSTKRNFPPFVRRSKKRRTPSTIRGALSRVTKPNRTKDDKGSLSMTSPRTASKYKKFDDTISELDNLISPSTSDNEVNEASERTENPLPVIPKHNKAKAFPNSSGLSAILDAVSNVQKHKDVANTQDGKSRSFETKQTKDKEHRETTSGDTTSNIKAYEDNKVGDELDLELESRGKEHSNKMEEKVNTETVGTVEASEVSDDSDDADTLDRPMPDYDSMSAEDREDARTELCVQLGILRKNYPEYNIPLVPREQTVQSLFRTYNRWLKQITVDESADGYKVYLVIMWLGIELFGSRILGMDMVGFALNQLSMMSKYSKMLIELGERSFNPISPSWPPEVRILVMSLINAVVFIIFKYISGILGPDVAKSVQSALSGMMDTDRKVGDEGVAGLIAKFGSMFTGSSGKPQTSSVKSDQRDYSSGVKTRKRRRPSHLD